MKLGLAEIYRDTFTRTTSTGKLYLSDNRGFVKSKLGEDYFCHTLEDASRGEHVKIMGETCIPSGVDVYKIILTQSPRFGRLMPIIITELNGYELKHKGISFLGSRLHGGNKHEHTHGCPLCAYSRLNDELIQGTAEKEITAALMKMGLKDQPIPLKEGFDYVALNVYNFPK